VKPLSSETKGYALAFVGIVVFALTLPATRWVVRVDSVDPLTPLFVTVCRASIAGFCGLAYLYWQKALVLPHKGRDGLLGALILSALGTVLAFPLFLGMGLTQAPSVQAAVVTGFMPICTAVFASLYFRQRQTLKFWISALVGFLLIVAFSLYQGLGVLRQADVFLVLAVVTGAAGYVSGVKVSSAIPASHAISWILVISLPLTLPATIWLWPPEPITFSQSLGLGYLGVFSMWLGFFAWYKGLVLGGTMRVSQVQLLQPFLALMLSAWLLGETLDLSTIAFALVLILTVLTSKRVSR
jgi:drug/metabolite transporter (DMT)-like permease